jgi:hypothetical protein
MQRQIEVAEAAAKNTGTLQEETTSQGDGESLTASTGLASRPIQVDEGETFWYKPDDEASVLSD